MADLLTLQGWLLEAQTARHNLLIGKMTASLSVEGKSISYTQADLWKLDAYIAGLQRKIDDANGVPRPRGPALMTF